MGRPRKSEPRNQQLNLSLTASELEGLCRRAAQLGMRPVHLGRALLLDRNPKASLKVSAEDNAARLIYGQLVRLGNNLNQISRQCHRLGTPPPADLEPLLAEIRRLIAQVPR